MGEEYRINKENQALIQTVVALLESISVIQIAVSLFAGLMMIGMMVTFDNRGDLATITLEITIFLAVSMAFFLNYYYAWRLRFDQAILTRLMQSDRLGIDLFERLDQSLISLNLLKSSIPRDIECRMKGVMKLFRRFIELSFLLCSLSILGMIMVLLG